MMSIIVITVIEFLIGSFMHFLYDIFPNVLTSLIAPVNESIFEHLKLALYPMLIVSFIVLYYYKKLNTKSLTALFFGIITSIMSIVLIYYFYHDGLGIESLILDIILLFVSIFIGNAVAYCVYQHNLEFNIYLIVGLFVGLILLFSVWTYFPPALPLFMDPSLQ